MKHSLMSVLVVILAALSIVPVFGQDGSNGFPPITMDNIDDVVLGYGLRGSCGMSSPDSNYLMISRGFLETVAD